MTNFHQTAVVDASANIAPGVEIGPYCVIGSNVTLAAGVKLLSHVVIDPNTTVGENTVVHPFSTLGMAPQHIRYKGEPSRLEIGKNNVIREHVTLHRGTEQGGMVTRVGDNCFFMVGSHVAHDCIIENNVILTNGVALGGHVKIGEFAIIGGQCGVQQFVRIGKYAMIGGKTGVDRDIIPYGSAQGNRAHLSGLNLIGLKRRGFSRADIQKFRAAYGLLFSQDSTMADRLNEVSDLYAAQSGVMDIVNFIRAESSRPLCTPSAAANGNGNGG
ncbi:MAG: acyl-ACP--UDP-N-acetylglucosamine O-acyltransferase [Rhodospirillaceae bacterium]|nr:acyl-ACP--UDP-N-acetylglucosamine O-acyltransferase [Rhodospirillaceae bacterium]